MRRQSELCSKQRRNRFCFTEDCEPMALPTLSKRWASRSLEQQMLRQRDREERMRRQWETHSQYFRQQDVLSCKQAQWSSRQSFQQSMAAYQQDSLKQEKTRSLEQRRERLCALLQNERDQLEAELRELVPDRAVQARQLLRRTEELRSAREERQRMLAQKLLQEHWKRNNPELRKMESALHQDHVVSQWKVQQSEKKKREEVSREEELRFENERERNQQKALERMREEEERRKAEARQRAEELQQQMEELKLREEEANRLKKEQEGLLSQRWEVERLEEERKKQEESRRKYELRCFLSRQYRAQLKRRAQQVQEELEDDRRILATLLEGEEEDRRLASARRERAAADAAWMQEVLEEQLQLEREREAEFDILHREEAQRVWAMREAEWEKERRARERLMQEVLAGRRQQLDQKMLENRWAQEESLRRREELIEQLEKEKEARRQEREQEAAQKTARMREINTQVAQQHKELREVQQREEQEEEEEKAAQRWHDEELQLELDGTSQRGFQEKIHSRPRSAWT